MSNYRDQSPEDEASERNHEAYVRGARSYAEGNYSAAKNEFKVALECWPEDPEAWMALGNCFDEMKKPKRAEECYRKALRYSADNRLSDVYYNLGNSLFDQARFEEAIECYRKVSAQSAVYAKASINLKKAAANAS